MLILLLWAYVSMSSPIQENIQTDWCSEGYIRNGECRIIHFGAKSNRTKYLFQTGNSDKILKAIHLKNTSFD